MADLAGRTLDRYELRRLIGKGGMADVYSGYDPRFERDVAVKVFKRGEDEDLLRRFVREARLMGSLHNTHLIPVYDTGETIIDGFTQYYIVMPYMTGGTLRERIRHHPLSLTETCRYLNDIAEALDYVHSQGIIHRDIKSSNVLLDTEGRCYIADFGIARSSSEATQMTSTGNVLGTVDYIAPELFVSGQKADVRSDLYSLGVLLFEMITGQLPFKAENPLAVVTMHATKQPPSPRYFVPNLPPQVERVVLKALEKNPVLRFGSASALARAFCEAASNRQSATGQTSSTAWIGNTATASTINNVSQAPLVLPPTTGVRRAPSYPQTGEAYGANPNTHQTGAYSGYQPPSPYTYPSQPAPTHYQEPARSRGHIVTIIALITFLAVLIPIAYVLYTNSHTATNPVITPTAPLVSGTTPSPTVNPTATPNTAATTQAIAAATATRQAQAASAASAGATATVQAQASATAGSVQTATAGQPVYTDTLTNPNNGATQTEQWDQNARCTFQGDGYHVASGSSLTGAGPFPGCREAGAQYSNATFSVDMTINSGNAGGLFFYMNPTVLDAYAGYLFEVDTLGRYRILRSANYSAGNVVALQDWANSSAIKPGAGATNHLQVVARSGTLLFYINGTLVSQQSDSTFTTGTMAFLATSADGGPTANVTYSNVAVYQ